MGLLIVTADDWGLDQPTTDAIHRCFVAGAITSVSAMVFMPDSDRAARLALAAGAPAGLHLNLSEAFAQDATPEKIRRRQARIVRYFNGPKWRRWGFSATLFTSIEDCIRDQLEEFRRLYGAQPTHVDGHEHLQQSISVLVARTLPRGTKMRPSFTYPVTEKSRGNRAFRAVINRVMRARFRTPRYFFSLRDMHPQLGGRGLEEKLALAYDASVEIMTHPGWADESKILLDPAWTHLLQGRPLGAYAELRPR